MVKLRNDSRVWLAPLWASLILQICGRRFCKCKILQRLSVPCTTSKMFSLVSGTHTQLFVCVGLLSSQEVLDIPLWEKSLFLTVLFFIGTSYKTSRASAYEASSYPVRCTWGRDCGLPIWRPAGKASSHLPLITPSGVCVVFSCRSSWSCRSLQSELKVGMCLKLLVFLDVCAIAISIHVIASEAFNRVCVACHLCLIISLCGNDQGKERLHSVLFSPGAHHFGHVNAASEATRAGTFPPCISLKFSFTSLPAVLASLLLLSSISLGPCGHRLLFACLLLGGLRIRSPIESF